MRTETAHHGLGISLPIISNRFLHQLVMKRGIRIAEMLLQIIETYCANILQDDFGVVFSDDQRYAPTSSFPERCLYFGTLPNLYSTESFERKVPAYRRIIHERTILETVPARQYICGFIWKLLRQHVVSRTCLLNGVGMVELHLLDGHSFFILPY